MLALWIVWFTLTAAVISLAIARKFAARNEDDFVHLSDLDSRAIAQQTTIARRLEWFDHWGKTLTIADVAMGVILVVIMLFTAWRQSLAMN